MANNVTHGLAGKVVMAQALLDEIESGTGTSVLKLLNAGKTATYATLNLVATTAGSVATATGIITFDCTPALEDTATTAGTAEAAQFINGDAQVCLECTVGITGCDINLSNNVFGTNDTVQITSLTYTPPS